MRECVECPKLLIPADVTAKKYVGRVREWFADPNIIPVGEDQVPVATASG